MQGAKNLPRWFRPEAQGWAVAKFERERLVVQEVHADGTFVHGRIPRHAPHANVVKYSVVQPDCAHWNQFGFRGPSRSAFEMKRAQSRGVREIVWDKSDGRAGI